MLTPLPTLCVLSAPSWSNTSMAVSKEGALCRAASHTCGLGGSVRRIAQYHARRITHHIWLLQKDGALCRAASRTCGSSRLGVTPFGGMALVRAG